MLKEEGLVKEEEGLVAHSVVVALLLAVSSLVSRIPRHHLEQEQVFRPHYNSLRLEITIFMEAILEEV